jgi:hypothetical protein
MLNRHELGGKAFEALRDAKKTKIYPTLTLTGKYSVTASGSRWAEIDGPSSPYGKIIKIDEGNIVTIQVSARRVLRWARRYSETGDVATGGDMYFNPRWY